MGKLFKNLKNAKAAVLAIIILLATQALCELTLPQYTSDIVDVGIQQSGMENAAMSKISKETFEALEQFMTDADVDFVKNYYELNEEGNYECTTKDSDIREQLSAILSKPMLLISGVAPEEIDALSDSVINQRALLFVQQEYAKLGIDVANIQIKYLLYKGLQMLLISLVSVLASITVGFLSSRVGAGIGRDLREKVFKKVVSFSNAEIDSFSTASLITRSTNDIQQVQMVTTMMLRMVVFAPIMGVGAIIKVAQTKTGMSWISVLAIALVLSMVMILMKVTLPKFKKMQSLVDNLNLVSREILTGIPVIRAFSREKFEEKRFDKANKELMETQLFTNRTMALMAPLMMFIMNAVSVLIVWVSAKRIDMGAMQVGDMIAFITYTMHVIMSFMIVSMMSIMLPRAGVAAERIDEVITKEITIKDKEDTSKADEALKDAKGVLAFDHVSFRYPNANEDVLKDITFTANPGETTAIIGSTGCGKSTLLNLIPRFYDVTEGKVTLDGVDIRDMSQAKLHSFLGLVPQKGVLFSGNIASNIKFGGEHITDEKMIEAAEISQSTEFIEEKNEKYESEIAQGGSNVSGGQKQRLSIARAIATDPKIYLFDDSFSALDYKTDVALRKALGKKTSDATVIIVAQRISTIMHADKIIVLEDGQIVGEGTHEELLANCENYQEIARSQLSEKELKGGKVNE